MILEVETVGGAPGTLRFTYARAQITYRDREFVWYSDDGYRHTMPVWR